MKPRKRLGELLIEAGMIDQQKLYKALAHQKQWGGRLGHTLVELGLISEGRLIGFLAKHFNLPAVDCRQIEVSDNILAMVKPNVAKQHNILPLFIDQGDDHRPFLVVAMANPTDLGVIDTLEFTCNMKIRPVIALDVMISDAVAYYYEHVKAAPPFVYNAKPSEEVFYDDLIKQTDNYIRSLNQDPHGATDPGNIRQPQSEHVFSDITKEEKPDWLESPDQAIRSSLAAMAQKPMPAAGRRSTAKSTLPGNFSQYTQEQVLQVLLEVLIAKGVITRDELLEKLQ